MIRASLTQSLRVAVAQGARLFAAQAAADLIDLGGDPSASLELGDTVRWWRGSPQGRSLASVQRLLAE